jgi:hypothetical protein
MLLDRSFVSLPTNSVPFLGANHKTGSRMIKSVATAVCAAGASSRTFVRAETFTVPTKRDHLCLTLTRCTLCHEPPGPNIEQLVQPANHTATLLMPPLYLLPELHGAIVLRDPINLVVSHFFYHLDGNEAGNWTKMDDGQRLKHWLADDVDRGLEFEMGFQGFSTSIDSRASAVHFVAQSLAFVLERQERMRIVCLEDFMQSEQSFYTTWANVLDFLSLDLPRGASSWHATLPALISQENPLSADANDAVKVHGSASTEDGSRALLVANYSQRVLMLDRKLNGGTGHSLLKLSAALQCYDWTGKGMPRERAQRPSWQL